MQDAADGPGGDGGAQDAPADVAQVCPLAGFLAEGGVACSGVPLLGSMVTQTCTVGSPPSTAAGGPLPWGTYVMTKSTVYATTTCPSVSPLQVTRYLCDQGQWAIQQSAGGTMETLVGVGTPQGTNIAYSWSCPSGLGSETVGYTMTGTTSGSTFTVYAPFAGTGTIVDEYSLQ